MARPVPRYNVQIPPAGSACTSKAKYTYISTAFHEIHLMEVPIPYRPQRTVPFIYIYISIHHGERRKGQIYLSDIMETTDG